MANARRIECFTTNLKEDQLYAGTTSGCLLALDPITFEVKFETQAHMGSIHSIVSHASLPYVAAIGNDRCLSIWNRSEDGALDLLSYASYRDLPASNDDQIVEPILSHSVALDFHPTERRIVTRTGNGATVELEFDEAGHLRLLWSKRLHGDWDLQMARYTAGAEGILTGGRDASLVYVQDGQEKRRWTFGDTVAHWAEHMNDDVYLIASDLGLVAKISLSSDQPIAIGARFARDDMELVTFNKTSRRAFCTSFDRNVYEIDVETCNAIGSVFQPGYKCIWAKTLNSKPSELIVLTRDGSLIRCDIDTGKTISVLKETPNALWSAVLEPNGSLVAAGEGNELKKFRVDRVDRLSRRRRFSVDSVSTSMDPASYTKRLARQHSSGAIVAARTDGDIWISEDYSSLEFAKLTNLGSAVRDIAVAPDRPDLFAATEDGRVLKIDLGSGDVLNSFQTEGEPFPKAVWALAFNPQQRLLAFAEFGRHLHVISADTFEEVDRIECDRVKRVRWCGSDELMFGSSDEIHRYKLGSTGPDVVVRGMQNTVEDFIWDETKQYILAISYQCLIGLFDYETGQELDIVRDQMDYSKGLSWLGSRDDTNGYPLDFVTWGRSGSCHEYRVHNERIMSLGPIADRNAGQAGEAVVKLRA